MFAARPFDPPPGVATLRGEVRDFLIANPPPADPVRRANCWAACDPGFSRALGAAGYVGMIWPKRYGGHDRHPLERYTVLEELLAAGASVGAHWIADRQTGPLLLRYGNEAQRERWLPGMAAGETYACIGLSEPGVGSDLAGVRTTARRTPEGWRVSGQKLWTSGAHQAHVMLALVRTEAGSERQAGLSQLLIPMDTPGVTVRPIVDVAGNHDFNEVFFDDALVPLEALVGAEGDGWRQVTAELALERSGPERYLSSFALYLELLRAAGPKPDLLVASVIGKFAAEIFALRSLSLKLTGLLAAGGDPGAQAAMMKDLGNSHEQALPLAVQDAIGYTDPETPLGRVLRHLLLVSPSFSLRGGTREVLRGIIARDMGLR